MELNRFIHKIMHGVQEFSGEDVRVELRRIVKNNGVVLDGLIMMKKGQNISPTIYLNDYFREYENGKPVSTIIYEIIKIYEEKQLHENFDMDYYTDYEKVRGKIAYKLIHCERNEALLKEIPHIRFLDLAIVFFSVVDNDIFGNATILIYHNHCKMWNVTAEDLYEEARKNMVRIMPPTLMNIQDVIRDIADVEEIEDVAHCPMYILTNRNKLFGAAVILYEGVLSDFAKQIGADVYILPSSIHEVILIPDSGNMDSKQLEEMVQEVNRTQLDVQEILSDTVYFYNRREGNITFADASDIVSEEVE